MCSLIAAAAFGLDNSPMSKRKRQDSQFRRDRRNETEPFSFIDTSALEENASNASTSSGSHVTQQSKIFNVVEWNIEGDSVSTVNSLTTISVTEPAVNSNMITQNDFVAVDSYQLIDAHVMENTTQDPLQHVRKPAYSVWILSHHC